MQTKYTKGFMAGVEYARTQVLEFLNAHHDLGDILTLEEVIREIIKWEITDIETLRGLQNDRLALQYGMEESPDICEECFGPDLCYVCKRT